MMTGYCSILIYTSPLFYADSQLRIEPISTKFPLFASKIGDMRVCVGVTRLRHIKTFRCLTANLTQSSF